MSFFRRDKIAYSDNIFVKINPEFSALGSFVNTIPQTFGTQGETIHCARNHIKILEVNGQRVNVKKYGIPPYFFNRIIYILLRDTKAKCSYDYALKLQSMALSSPTPIGYYLQKKGLLLSHCYLLTEQMDNAYHLCDLDKIEGVIDPEVVLREFGLYTATLHKKGILHYDYSFGNIMFRIENGKPQFSLVDINRIRFCNVSFDAGCRNFNRFRFSPEQLEIIAESYATAMGYDKSRCYDRILFYRDKKARFFNRKRKIKDFFKIR